MSLSPASAERRRFNDNYHKYPNNGLVIYQRSGFNRWHGIRSRLLCLELLDVPKNEVTS